MSIVLAYVVTVALATLVTFTYIIRGLQADFVRLRVAGRRPIETHRAA